MKCFGYFFEIEWYPSTSCFSHNVVDYVKQVGCVCVFFLRPGPLQVFLGYILAILPSICIANGMNVVRGVVCRDSGRFTRGELIP